MVKTGGLSITDSPLFNYSQIRMVQHKEKEMMLMSGTVFNNGIFRAFVPTGWNCFYGIDSEGEISMKKVHIYKDAQTELDIFTHAGLTVCYYGKEDYFLSPKFIYEDVRDLKPFVCGNYRWKGYTCTSLGYPYTMLTATSGGITFYVMMLMENGKYKISLQDADVRAILEGIAACE